MSRVHSRERSNILACRQRVQSVLAWTFLWSFLFTAIPIARGEAVATFQGLGDLPGGPFDSASNSVSSDGSVVVGIGRSALGQEAFRWTQSGGMVGLGNLPGGVTSNAISVSADGMVVVGAGSSASGGQAFRWTNGTGMVGLGDLPGGSYQSAAYGVSTDGSVVVGAGQSASGQEAFRWTSSTGLVGLGDLPGGSFLSTALDTSSDGLVVVGFSGSASGREAFRWTQSGGMVGLGDLLGGSFDSTAEGISSDGSVIVGVGRSGSGYEAFRWTSSTGMVGLGFLPGGSQSFARGVSPDGSIVVGNANSGSGPEAFVWTADSGMQTLSSVLADFGASLIDLTRLQLAEDLQTLGNTATIVGYGDSPSGTQAYRAQIPIVSASLADELLTLTPGLTSDTLALDISATRLLYGDVGRYEFDFTTDGIYDLVLDVGTPLFDSYWDALTESFLFPELDVRSYYPAINAGGFGSISFTTTIRMTHENGTAINTSEAIITVVPEVQSWLLGSIVPIGLTCLRLTRRRVI